MRYFLEGLKFMDVLREMEDLNQQALHFRILRWLAETQPTVLVLLC